MANNHELTLPKLAPAPLPPTFEVQELIDVENLLRFASFQRWLDGSEPFMVDKRIEHSVAVKDVLPDEATVERTTRDNTVFALLARTSDATIAIETGSSYARVRITSTSSDRADALLAEVSQRAEAAINDKTPFRV
jgi:hypothetical protein